MSDTVAEATSLHWLGSHYSSRPNDHDTHYALITVGRVPFLLSGYEIRGQWATSSLDLLSPCCFSVVEGFWAKPNLYCRQPGCTRSYCMPTGKPWLISESSNTRLSESLDVMNDWAEHWGYDPLQAVILSSVLSDLDIDGVIVPTDLPYLTPRGAEELCAVTAHEWAAQ